MHYTKSYFDKENITDILHQDVVDFFKIEREESNKIEYKSFVSIENETIKEKMKGVLKSICGFLNSDGGLLIWGAPVGKKQTDKKEKIFIGDLSLVDQFFEKDQLISKITDSITPAPSNIFFHRIENQGKYIYILEVERSEYSPHQVGDTFYMRIDGQTKPAPYHYIEALFKKIKYPNLSGFLKIDTWQYRHDACQLSINPYFFNFSKLQNDYNLSYRLLCDLGKFQGHNSINFNSKTQHTSDGHEKIRTNIKDVIHYGEPVHESSVIVFETAKLRESKMETSIILTFGAKYSPLKMCIYKLRLSPTMQSDKLSECFIEINENKLASEKSDKSDLEKVEFVINRKIK